MAGLGKSVCNVGMYLTPDSGLNVANLETPLSWALGSVTTPPSPPRDNQPSLAETFAPSLRESWLDTWYINTRTINCSLASASYSECSVLNLYTLHFPSIFSEIDQTHLCSASNNGNEVVISSANGWSLFLIMMSCTSHVSTYMPFPSCTKIHLD